jgi:hypothetical protein
VTTYIQCKTTGKFIEKSKFLAEAHSAAVLVMDSFVSPLDGSLIRDPAQLRAHNRKHGVTDSREYGGDYFDRKNKERGTAIQGQARVDKQDRIEALKRATTHVRT